MSSKSWEDTRSLLLYVPFQMSIMQFHRLLLVVLIMPWSTSFPHTWCKSSILTNVSERLSRNGPKKPFHLFRDVLIALPGPCSVIPVLTKMSMQTVTSYISFCIDSCSPSKTVTIYANDKPWFSKDIKHKFIARTLIKASTKQLNMKLRRLSEEQKHSTKINLNFFF